MKTLAKMATIIAERPAEGPKGQAQQGVEM
jgi:hypothetical protein